ncbi:MAG: thiamine-phosphate pyrophosphorylase [bacterium]
MKRKIMDKNIIKVIDVNVNRAREGLRVIEDTVRLIKRDSFFFKQLRSFRHKVSELFKSGETELIAARTANSDIGRSSRQLAYRDVDNIVKANFKRVQESLRVLEEYSRLCFKDKVQDIKRIRFKIYSLEKRYYEQYKVVQALYY